MQISLNGMLTPQDNGGGGGFKRRVTTGEERTQQWVRDGGRLGRRSSLNGYPEEIGTEDPNNPFPQCPLVVKGTGQDPL